MVYVYCRHIDSGKEYFCNYYDSWYGAIEGIRIRLNSDASCEANGHYYYFAKEK